MMKAIPSPILRASVDMAKPYVGENLTETELAKFYLQIAAKGKSPAPVGEEFLTAEEFCKRASLCRSSCWRLRKAGVIRTVSLPGIRAVRIPASELVRLASAGLGGAR